MTMKTTANFSGLLALGLALGLGWTGCRSTEAEKVSALPTLKPVNSPVPPPAAAPAAVPAPPAGPPAVATAAPTSTAQVAVTTAPSNAAPPAETATATPAEPALPMPPATNAPLARVAPEPPADLSPGVLAVVDMVNAQVSPPVLLEYVNTTTNTFRLEADDIVYLKDLGVPDEVVTAMLKRAGGERAPAAVTETTPAPTAPEGASPAPAQAQASTQPAPAPPPSTYDQTVTPAPAPAAPPPPSAPPVTENYFYSSLAPYGTWLYIEPYGWCWQPTVAVVDRSWRPYLHGGRWVYTSAGWYWQSYYTWGWAPFHYGNWYLSPVCGWVWVPGHVWAPAWVVWRYSDAYCGWAPLPPGCGWHPSFGLTYWGSRVSVSFGFHLGWSSFVFCAWDDWWRPFPHRHCLPPHRSAVVFHQTTIINNYYVDKSRNTIVNEGVPPTAMPTRVRQELRKVELADVTPENSRLLRPERAAATYGKLAVYRPQVPPDLKLASAKPGEAPLRPLRTRSEADSPSRALRVPERTPALAAGRPERTGVTPARPVPTMPAPERLNRPTRTEAPQRGPAASPPTRSGSDASPGAASPSRREIPARTPSAPGRQEPATHAPISPERTRTPQAGPVAPQRQVPTGITPPARSSIPVTRPPTVGAPTTPAPSRGEAPGPRAPSRSDTQPAPAPVPRVESPARVAGTPVPNRSTPPLTSPGPSAVPRWTPSVPPARTGGPDLNSGAPIRSWTAPPSRSGPAAPERFAPPTFAPPAPQPSFRSAPPARSYSSGSPRVESGEQSGAGRPSRIQER